MSMYKERYPKES